jgi:hypothetical protein
LFRGASDLQPAGDLGPTNTGSVESFRRDGLISFSGVGKSPVERSQDWCVLQAGDAAPITQAANNLPAFGYAVQRPNCMTSQIEGLRSGSTRRRSLLPGSTRSAKTFRLSERVNFEFRTAAFNVGNTPPLNDPNGSFGSAAFGTTPARAILAILSLQETPVLTRIPHRHESRRCSGRSL